MPYAVRFDAPARLNRPGARNAFLHALERRAMRRARVTVPLSVAGAEALPDGRGAARWSSRLRSTPRSRTAPSPPSASGSPSPTSPTRRRRGSTWPSAGWAARAQIEGARLEVYGLDPERARSHLRRTGVPEPDSVELRGTVPAAEFRARLRRARVFVHGARWEDWGQAPLEALADGALLATVPAGGPYEALRVARRLEPSLVADAIEPEALAAAIRAAFELPDERVRDYGERAAELLRPYRSDAVQETVERELLPALLG